MTDFLIKPNIRNKSLYKFKKAVNENNEIIDIPVIEERPLTLYLNNQEIVTMMTIGDYPEYLSIGYLYNQGMLKSHEDVKKIEYLKELAEFSLMRKKDVLSVDECPQKLFHFDFISLMDSDFCNNPDKNFLPDGVNIVLSHTESQKNEIMEFVKLHSKEYELGNISDRTKEMIKSLNFTNDRIQELNRVLILLRRAKYSYIDDLKKEMLANKAGFIITED